MSVQHFKLVYDPKRTKQSMMKIEKLAECIDKEDKLQTKTSSTSTAYYMIRDSAEKNGKIFKLKKSLKNNKSMPKLVFL